jgi:cation transport regulator ChaB
MMPYSNNVELPSSVKNALPTEAQSIWRQAFNASHAAHQDEGRAAAAGWTAVQNAGWHKNEQGEWVKKVSKASVDVGLFVQVEKIDEEKQIVFGWGSVTSVNGQTYIDKQEDIIEDLELEKAVYEFMQAPMHDEMHQRVVPSSVFVESVVITDEKLQKMFPGQPLPIGKRGWWVGIHIADQELFQKHKSGEYTGFSITGRAIREEVQ